MPAKNQPPPAERLARAAELRAAGSSWDAVAREVGRAAETVRRWPALHPAAWRAALRAAERALLTEATAESVLTLRKQLRSGDEKAGRDAAQKLIQFRVALRKKKPAGTGTPKPAAADPNTADLEGMSDADLDALLDRLIPAYLADRDRRRAGAPPASPPVA